MLPLLGELRPWTDPEIVAIGRLPMHVPMQFGDDARELVCRRVASRPRQISNRN